MRQILQFIEDIYTCQTYAGLTSFKQTILDEIIPLAALKRYPGMNLNNVSN